MKIIVLGLAFNGRDSYIRSPWNILDLVVVTVNILVLTLSSIINSEDIIWLRALRAFRWVNQSYGNLHPLPYYLRVYQSSINEVQSVNDLIPLHRALRPLRAARAMDGIRVVVAAMVYAIPGISEIFLVASIFYYIFAVLGVNLMMGQFDGCASGGSFLVPDYLIPDGNINRTWYVPIIPAVLSPSLVTNTTILPLSASSGVYPTMGFRTLQPPTTTTASTCQYLSGSSTPHGGPMVCSPDLTM